MAWTEFCGNPDSLVQEVCMYCVMALAGSSAKAVWVARIAATRIDAAHILAAHAHFLRRVGVTRTIAFTVLRNRLHFALASRRHARPPRELLHRVGSRP